MNREKHKLPRRILALLLTLAMFVTMFPTAMFATNEKTESNVPDLDVSKSKTAENLVQQEDGSWQSDVTLSLPAADYSQQDRKSTRLNSSHVKRSRMPSSA